MSKNNNKSLELLKSITQDGSRFTQYAHQKFSQIIDLEKERYGSNLYQYEEGRRNKSLNRYTDIIPFDNNCIKLTDKRLGKSNNDYINASWILPPFDIPRIYIATQGPTQSTLIDFWRLVIEKQVPIIVCLTPQIEKRIEKCAKYWPIGDEILEFNHHEGYTVKVWNTEEKRDENADCIIRTISIEYYHDTELLESTTVTQLQFLGWPDHGVPNETKQVIALVKLTRHYSEINKPILVHCSAGVGRTGTFCVIDSGEELLKLNEELYIDPVFLLTDTFRKQRTTMVQAQAQYNFCYKAIKDFMTT
jgi:tyrosine-protein phosphatase non-receptor type 12/18/22